MTPPPATQASLFDDPASFPEAEAGPSHDRDDPSMRARRLVAQFGRQLEPVQRVRLALELSGLAETIIAEAVDDARRVGRSWRQLGVDLGVPFQTLFRRYGTPPTVEHSRGRGDKPGEHAPS